MKVYYLKLTEADFNKDGKVWTSPVIDLYDNEASETNPPPLEPDVAADLALPTEWIDSTIHTVQEASYIVCPDGRVLVCWVEQVGSDWWLRQGYVADEQTFLTDTFSVTEANQITDLIKTDQSSLHGAIQKIDGVLYLYVDNENREDGATYDDAIYDSGFEVPPDVFGTYIYKSVDNGATWTLHGTLPINRYLADVYDGTWGGPPLGGLISVHPPTGNWVIVSTEYVNSFSVNGCINRTFVSVDAGETWTATGTAFGNQVYGGSVSRNIAVASNGYMYFTHNAFAQGDSLHESTDGGLTWSIIEGYGVFGDLGTIEMITEASPIIQDPWNPEQLIVANLASTSDPYGGDLLVSPSHPPTGALTGAGATYAETWSVYREHGLDLDRSAVWVVTDSNVTIVNCSEIIPLGSYTASSELALITALATPSYRNYSTVKSSYGTDRLGNSVWTGMYDTTASTPDYQNGTPESGIISGGRYIDHTGRIDLVDYEVTVTNAPGVGLVEPHLSVWHIDDLEQEYPFEWAGKEDITPDGTTDSGGLHSAILIVDAYRYAKFELNIHTDLDVTDIGLELLVRVRIEDPVQGEPLFARTRRMLDEFPEWMDIREIENVDHATPETATPDSLGGKLFSATAGQWLNHIDASIDYLQLQEYIKTASTDQVAWVYRTENVPEAVIKVLGDGVELGRCTDLEDFYALLEDEEGFWWDVDRQIIYTRKRYESFSVNWDTSYTQSLQHVWNTFDDFGMSVDLPRHYNESNEIYKIRILDVYINFPGAGVESFKLALRRELNLWLSEGATPLSTYSGATPEVLEMQDIEQDSIYVTPDGLPTVRFRSLVLELAKKYPSTWGFFVWNDNLWDTGGIEGEGYDVLPNVMDVDNPPTVQSGVGDGNDLYVFRPDVVTGPRTFEIGATIRGRQRADRTEYREIKFDVDVWLSANKPLYTNTEQTIWLTIEYTPNLATPVGSFYHSFSLNVTNDASNGVAGPTTNSVQGYQFLDPAGSLIPGMVWYLAGTDDPYTGNGADGTTLLGYTIGDADLLKLRSGKYNPETQTFSDTAIAGVAEAWFTDDDANVLDSTVPIDSTTGRANRVMAWSVVPPVITYTDTWNSEKHRVAVTLNGLVPDQGQLDFDYAPPYSVPGAYATSNFKYVVEIVSTPYFMGTDEDLKEVAVDFPIDKIAVNSLTAWSSNKQEFVVGTTSSLNFSSLTSTTPVYPCINPNQWSAFEESLNTTIEGVVDENGPWRNGNAPVEGNTNFVLDYVEFTRADFGLAETGNYIVTWFGIYLADGDDRVVVWTDTNSVKPAGDDGRDVDYPADAIQEYLDTTSLEYYFSPIALKARLLPGPDLEWNPQVHSGWFYENDQEYYMYADPQTETATSAHWMLEGVARQGAPIIATSSPEGTVLRQVANWTDAAPHYTLTHTETITGNGTTSMYLSNENVHDLVITNLNTGGGATPAGEVYYTSSNVVNLEEASDEDTEYEVSYILADSFFADNNYIDPASQTQRTVLHFDATPHVEVMYEGSKFDPAAPVELPLNTYYTVQDEGFIFLDHEEYPLASTEIRLNPSTIVADGEDYMLLSIRAFDTYGNPKPGAEYRLTIDWGNFIGPAQDVIMVCDDDGFGTASIYAEASTSATPGLIGTIHITTQPDDSTLDEDITFDIKPKPVKGYRLSAIVTSDMVPADGLSQNYVVGKVEDTSYQPIEDAVVHWNKGRYMKDVLDVVDSSSLATPGFAGTAGAVVSDDEGYFRIGPFTAATPWDPGYWFVSARTDRTIVDYGSATPGAPDTFTQVGDAVTWLEYPDIEFGNEAFDDLPVSLVQWRTPAETATPYTPLNSLTFPVTVDDEDPYEPATPVTPTWTPPAWYAIDRYTQYQMSMLGNDRFDVDYGLWLNSNPDYRDV